jgi:hypothetical protein
MESFVIRIDAFHFAPKALERRGKLWGTVVRGLKGTDGRSGYLVRLAEPITTVQGWRPRRVEYLLVSPRDPGDELTAKSYAIVVEVSYVLDPALVRADEFRPEQVDYIALGHASAGITD